MKKILATFVVLLIVFSPVRADSLSVSVTCIEQVPGYDKVVAWFGYSLDATVENGSFAYIGNVEIIPFEPDSGDYPYAARAWVSNHDPMFAIGGWSGDEYLYSEAWYRPGDDVPECDGQQPTDTPTLDDAGVVNNPMVNPNANICYEPGQVCTSDGDWVRGWYLIRQQYGMN